MKLNPFGKHLHSQVIWPLMFAAAVVGIVATLVAVGILGGVTERWLDESSRGTVTSTVAAIEAMHNNLSRTMEILSSRSSIVDDAVVGDPAALEEELQIVNGQLGCDALSILDDRGNVVASVGRFPLARGASPFPRTRETWSPMSGAHPAIVDTESGLAMVSLAPVDVPGKGTWSLITLTVIDNRLLATFDAGLAATTLLVRGDGTLVADAFDSSMRGGALATAVQSGSKSYRAAITELLANPDESRGFKAGDKQYWIAMHDLDFGGHPSYGKIYVASIVDASVAVDTRTTTTQLIAMWSLLGVLILFFLNSWVARSVSEPLTRLSKSAARVAEGDFSAKVSIIGSNDVTELAANFNRMTDSLRDRSETLTKKVLELATLYEMSRSLGSTLELDTLLESVLDSALRIFGVEIGYITMVDRETGTLELRSWKGADLSHTTDSTVRNSMSEWVIREGRPLMYNPRTDGEDSGPGDEVTGALAALCVPLPSSEGIIGAITVGSRSMQQRFTSDDVRLLSTIANHVTIAVGNIGLFSSVQEAYLATVRALAAAVDAKDPYTRGHSDGVAAFALRIGEAMNFSAEQMVALEMAAYLHDIGKIGIPEDILLKPGKLTDVEMSQMRHHPLIGANILKPVAFPWPIAPIVRHHHEAFDGSGYPAGLRSEEIPILARVITVADSFEAMVADRPYRRGRSHQEAMLELRRCSGAQFDPRVVDAFIEVLEGLDQRIELPMSVDEIGADEAQAVYIAICDGLFSGFRRLGGPRLANNLERTVNERYAEEGIPLVLQAGRLLPVNDDFIDEDVTEHLARALGIMTAEMEKASGAGLAEHFLEEALEALPERMREHAQRLGFAPSS